MKYFIFRILSFAILFTLSIIILTYFGNKLLENSNYYRLSNTTNYIVFGDSKPECSFNDTLINKFKNMSSSGDSYFYIYLKAKKIIPNNKQIEAVFIEFSNNSIGISSDSTIWNDTYLPIRLPTYFPLMEYEDVRVIYKKNKQGFKKVFAKSILKNNFRNYKYLLFNEKGFKKDDRFGGYLYLLRNKTDSLVLDLSKRKELIKTSEQLSSTNLEYLSKLIDYCGQHNVKVFLIRCPLHEKNSCFQNEQIFKELLFNKFSNIEFLDFSKFPLLNSEFGDFSHLNHKGANRFSKIFDSLLQNGILHKMNKQLIIDDLIIHEYTSKPFKTNNALPNIK